MERLYSSERSRPLPAAEPAYGVRSLYTSGTGFHGGPGSWVPATSNGIGSYDFAVANLRLPPPPPPPPPLQEDALPGGLLQSSVPRVVSRGGPFFLEDYGVPASDPLGALSVPVIQPMLEEQGIAEMYAMAESVPEEQLPTNDDRVAIENGNGEGLSAYSSSQAQDERTASDLMAERCSPA